MSEAATLSFALRPPRFNWNGRSWVKVQRWKSPIVLMRVERWDPRRDGPLTESALRHKIETRGYQVSARTYPPDTVVTAQSVESERLDAVASGLLRVTLDGESAILTAGDMVFVPRGSARRVEVVGSSPAHCLEAVYG
jgi:quercetin dioxygenase-like cupin family protein